MPRPYRHRFVLGQELGARELDSCYISTSPRPTTKNQPSETTEWRSTVPADDGTNLCYFVIFWPRKSLTTNWEAKVDVGHSFFNTRVMDENIMRCHIHHKIRETL